MNEKQKIITSIFWYKSNICATGNYGRAPKFQTFGFSHEHPLWLPLVIFTLPVNILLFGLAMVDLSFSLIFILQTIVFLICWGVIHLMIKTLLSARKKRNKT